MTMALSRALPLDEYHVGWICAIKSEMAAAMVMLDEEHGSIQTQDSNDHNSYELGRLHSHNVVIACLPEGDYGTTNAATVAKDMLRTFTSLRFGLMVGIGGGVPCLQGGIDLRLGDVVVSKPGPTSGGVIQYDRGTSEQEAGFRRRGVLCPPPSALLKAVSRLRAKHEYQDSQMSTYLSQMVEKYPKMKAKGYIYQGAENDRLYDANYIHERNVETCEKCISDREISRAVRQSTEPQIYYGIIASGNQVMKDARKRDQLREELGVLCFEMEAAGLMTDFPCLVIRGICDYADSHKNDRWQNYAAATAAAFAKELLLYVSAEQVSHEKPIVQVSGQ